MSNRRTEEEKFAIYEKEYFKAISMLMYREVFPNNGSRNKVMVEPVLLQ